MTTPPVVPRQRARYLDITKGLAIICIVFLHFGTGLLPMSLNIYIGAFMITTFYITAGWVESFKPREPSFRLRVQRLWHQLGIPYVVWTIIILAFDVIFLAIGHYDTFQLYRDLYKSICLRGISTLWFLPALFGGQCLWWCIRRTHRWWVVLISLVALYWLIIEKGIFISHLISGMPHNSAQLVLAPSAVINSVVNAYVGIVCGFVYGKLSTHCRLAQRSLWLLIPLGLMGLGLGWYFTFMLPFNVGIFWNWLAPNVIPAGFIVLFMAFETSPILRYFDYWGRNSMALMVTHMSILLVIADILTLQLEGHKVRGYGWLTFFTFCIVMLLEYFIAECLRRYFPRCIGHTPSSTKTSTIYKTENAKHS